MSKTTERIAADCGITSADELLALSRALGLAPSVDGVSLYENDLHGIIGALYRRIEMLELPASFFDLKCERCGHHAHPDDSCGHCAAAELKAQIEKYENADIPGEDN